jgi:serine/threonine protein kinase
MGQVWEAVHTSLQKRVAIKFLSAELCAGRSPAMVERFLQEGLLACQVNHPNIVDVTDVGVHDGVPYLVMEFLDGLSLAERLRDAPIPWQDAVDLLLPVTAALHAAHEAGVVHRDIKPANIIVVKGSTGQAVPKLVDFGISRLHGSEFTRANLLLGTPGFMAPELLSGQSRGDPLTDQYALGITLQEMVACRPQVASAGSVVPPRKIQQAIPGALEQVIQCAMNPDPTRRFASVRELGAALLNLASVRQRLNWEPILDPNEHSDTIERPPRPIVTRRRQVRGYYGLLLFALLLIGSLGVVFWHQLAPASPPHPTVEPPISLAVSPPGPPHVPAPRAEPAKIEEKPVRRKPARERRKPIKRKRRRKNDAPKTDNRDPWAG